MSRLRCFALRQLTDTDTSDKSGTYINNPYDTNRAVKNIRIHALERLHKVSSGIYNSTGHSGATDMVIPDGYITSAYLVQPKEGPHRHTLAHEDFRVAKAHDAFGSLESKTSIDTKFKGVKP